MGFIDPLMVRESRLEIRVEFEVSRCVLVRISFAYNISQRKSARFGGFRDCGKQIGTFFSRKGISLRSRLRMYKIREKRPPLEYISRSRD